MHSDFVARGRMIHGQRKPKLAEPHVIDRTSQKPTKGQKHVSADLLLAALADVRQEVLPRHPPGASGLEGQCHASMISAPTVEKVYNEGGAESMAAANRLLMSNPDDDDMREIAPTQQQATRKRLKEAKAINDRIHELFDMIEEDEIQGLHANMLTEGMANTKVRMRKGEWEAAWGKLHGKLPCCDDVVRLHVCSLRSTLSLTT